LFEPNTHVVSVATHLAFARPLTSDNAAARLILGRGMVAVSQLRDQKGCEASYVSDPENARSNSARTYLKLRLKAITTAEKVKNRD
jgi:hypothetical protein